MENGKAKQGSDQIRKLFKPRRTPDEETSCVKASGCIPMSMREMDSHFTNEGHPIVKPGPVGIYTGGILMTDGSVCHDHGIKIIKI